MVIQAEIKCTLNFLSLFFLFLSVHSIDLQLKTDLRCSISIKCKWKSTKETIAKFGDHKFLEMSGSIRVRTTSFELRKNY